LKFINNNNKMPIYWEKSTSGIQMENSDTKEEDEDYEIQKLLMQSIKD